MYNKSLRQEMLKSINDIDIRLKDLNNRLEYKNNNHNNIQETVVPQVLNRQSLIEEIEKYKDLLL